MTILPTLALRSFVGFDNLFNELETISTQKHNSFPAHDILRISDDEGIDIEIVDPDPIKLDYENVEYFQMTAEEYCEMRELKS